MLRRYQTRQCHSGQDPFSASSVAHLRQYASKPRGIETNNRVKSCLQHAKCFVSIAKLVCYSVNFVKI